MVEFRDWPRAEIHSIAAPTLIVTGDHDIVRPEHAVDLYRLLPHARLAILPGTDHMTMVKRADWLVPMVTGFLDAPAE
jgi:pimeloyl-ACP methyl ester carboxylesterase